MDFDLAGNDFFSASPYWRNFLAVVIAMLGVGLAGIIEVCNILITPTIYLLLKIFMLALGALMLFFLGASGGTCLSFVTLGMMAWALR